MANWTGVISSSVTFADADHITGNVTVAAGGTVTVNAGATIYVDGNFSLSVTGGTLVSTGTRPSRITWRANATNNKSGDWVGIIMNNYTTTGNTIIFNVIRNANAPALEILAGAGSTATYQDIDIYNYVGTTYGGFFIDPSAVNVTGTRVRCHDATSTTSFGFVLGESSGSRTHTLVQCEAYNVDIGFTSAANLGLATFTRCYAHHCYTAGFKNNHTQVWTLNPSIAVRAKWNFWKSAAGSILMKNPISWGGQPNSVGVYDSTNTGAMSLDNGDIMLSFGNAVILGTGAGTVINVTNCYVAGGNNADIDNADTTTTAGPGSSGESPAQFSLVNRRTGTTTRIFPETIDTVAVTTLTQGATITFNSNCPLSSALALSTVSTGADPDDSTTNTLGIGDYNASWTDLDSRVGSGGGTYRDKSGGFMGTAHSLTVSGLDENTTYYYRAWGRTPWGTLVKSTQGSFTTTANEVSGGGSKGVTVKVKRKRILVPVPDSVYRKLTKNDSGSR